MVVNPVSTLRSEVEGCVDAGQCHTASPHNREPRKARTAVSPLACGHAISAASASLRLRSGSSLGYYTGPCLPAGVPSHRARRGWPCGWRGCPVRQGRSPRRRCTGQRMGAETRRTSAPSVGVQHLFCNLNGVGGASELKRVPTIGTTLGQVNVSVHDRRQRSPGRPPVMGYRMSWRPRACAGALSTGASRLARCHVPGLLLIPFVLTQQP